MSKVLAVLSVSGRDQKGVVARFATYLAERGVNIEDLQQHVVRGMFVMDMLVDLADVGVSLDELVPELMEIGRSLNMDARLTLNSQRRPKKVAVLVSHEPHCLEQLIEDRDHGLLRGEIDCVLSNHEKLRPVAERAGIEYLSKPSDDKPAHMEWVRETMQRRGIDVAVLARYMQVLTPDVVNAFPWRIINIHPSLLPHFPGSRPYEQAYQQGVRVSGCTAHYVTEQLDEGPIILQDVFHIEVGVDGARDVRRKGIELEGHVLSRALQYHLNEQLVIVDGSVAFKPGLSDLMTKAQAAE